MPDLHVELTPVDEPPTPDRIHNDRSPADRFFREMEEHHREQDEIRANETPEERDARIYKLWVNRDGVTFSRGRMTIVDIAEESERHTVTCPCWMHGVLRHYERTRADG